MNIKLKEKKQVVACKACGSEMNSAFKKCPNCSTYNNVWGRLFFLGQVIAFIIGVVTLLNMILPFIKPEPTISVQYIGSSKFRVINSKSKLAELKKISAQMVVSDERFDLTPRSKSQTEIEVKPITYSLKKYQISPHAPFTNKANQSIVFGPNSDETLNLKNFVLRLKTEYNLLNQHYLSPTKDEQQIAKINSHCKDLGARYIQVIKTTREISEKNKYVCAFEFEFSKKIDSTKITVPCTDTWLANVPFYMNDQVSMCSMINSNLN